MSDPIQPIRKLVWLYFWLLMLEGALRKWLVPGLSTALLIVRDPVVVAIYILAAQRGVFPKSPLVSWTAIVGVLCFAASFAGQGNLAVTLYGMRADFLHLPLIVVLPNVLRGEDVRKIGFALLALLPGMALLAILQFKGGPESHWNVGAGGEVGAQLYADEGKVRASGTFSFSTGFATYLALCAAFLVNDLLVGRIYPRWLMLASVPALVLSLVVSGSRTAVIAVGVVCGMVIVMAVQRPKEFGQALRPVLATLVTIAILSLLTPLFDEGIKVHKRRFEGGGGFQQGIVFRYAQEFTSALEAIETAPMLGIGLGVGTNAGATLLRGRRDFILGEGELERLIYESGGVLGLAVIALRCGVLLLILRTAFRSYAVGKSLPLLLVAVDGVDLVTGKFGQPTALGFAVFTAGLTLAAASGRPPVQSEIPSEKVPVATAQRGRSRYAERLHREESGKERE